MPLSGKTWLQGRRQRGILTCFRDLKCFSVFNMSAELERVTGSNTSRLDPLVFTTTMIIEPELGCCSSLDYDLDRGVWAAETGLSLHNVCAISHEVVAWVEELGTRRKWRKSLLFQSCMATDTLKALNNSSRVRKPSRKSPSLCRKEVMLSLMCCTLIMHFLRRLGGLPCHKTQQGCT